MSREQRSSARLQQFTLLAKGAKGQALNTLINQLLEAPGVYVFGEFLDLPNIKEVLNSFSVLSQLLKIFAYGTYHDYTAFKHILPPLNDLQRTKLRHLTIVTLATNTQVLPYCVLMSNLELNSIRQLEDLLIDALYANVFQGKLDQCKQQLEVDSCISRDVPLERTSAIIDTLTQWCSDFETSVNAIEQQVHRVNMCREDHLHTLQRTEAKVEEIRNQIRVTPCTSSSQLARLRLSPFRSKPRV